MTMPTVTREMLRDRWMRAAAAALGGAALVLIAAVVSAIRVGSVEAAAPSVMVADSALRFGALGPPVNIGGAVARDLFTDDRHAPARRYRLPGEVDAPERTVASRPIVLGTVLGAADTVVELVGTVPITALSTGAAGVLSLHG